MTLDTLFHDTWVVVSSVAVFVSWFVTLAVVVDNAHVPEPRKPNMLTRLIVYTLPLPVTIVTLAAVVMWR